MASVFDAGERSRGALEIGIALGELLRASDHLLRHRLLLATAQHPLWTEVLDRAADLRKAIVNITNERERFPGWVEVSRG